MISRRQIRDKKHVAKLLRDTVQQTPVAAKTSRLLIAKVLSSLSTVKQPTCQDASEGENRDEKHTTNESSNGTFTESEQSITKEWTADGGTACSGGLTKSAEWLSCFSVKIEDGGRDDEGSSEVGNGGICKYIQC